jgi:hypothetical protein
VLKLSAAIISFGRTGEHFNQHGGIDYCIIHSLCELWRSANDRQVRIRQKAGGLDLDSQVSIKGHASIVGQTVTKLAAKIASNKAVLQCAARHGKHLTVKELALEFRGAFNRKIFRLCQSTRCLRQRHNGCKCSAPPIQGQEMADGEEKPA